MQREPESQRGDHGNHDGGAAVKGLGPDVALGTLVVANDYFSRLDGKGACKFDGDLAPTFHLFNGRLTFAFHIDKGVAEGTAFVFVAEVADEAGHGPFRTEVSGTVSPPREKVERDPPKDKKAEAVASRPNILEVHNGPDDPPVLVQRPPKSKVLLIVVNSGSRLLAEAKGARPAEEASAVHSVFKYGLALIATSLIESAKKTPS